MTSNLVPMISSSPPPLELDDEAPASSSINGSESEDDEDDRDFGDFTKAEYCKEPVDITVETGETWANGWDVTADSNGHDDLSEESGEKLGLPADDFQPFDGQFQIPVDQEQEQDCDWADFGQAVSEDNGTFETEGSFREDPGVCEDDDDDFADFQEATPSEPAVSIAGNSSEGTADSQSVTQVDRNTVYLVLGNVFPLPSKGLAEDDDECGVRSCARSLDDILVDNSVTRNIWENMCDVEKTIALRYHWSRSRASEKLMQSLNIDSRNVLNGSKWNSSIPPFAANMSQDLLKPQPVTPQQNCSASAAPVTPTLPALTSDNFPLAQFDWNGSGLVNPLDGLECEFLRSECQSAKTVEPKGNSAGTLPLLEKIMSDAKMMTSLARKQGTRRNNLSADAQKVLDVLPDLSFMKSKVLMFPIRSTTPP